MPDLAYACTTNACSERFRGFTDEPTFCSVCMEDLTPFPTEGRSLDELNALAAAAPRPMPEAEAEAEVSVDVVVRMGMSVADGKWLSDNLNRLPADVQRCVLDQVWLRAVLTEQRRRTNRDERAAFDRRADQILAALDPQEVPCAV